MSKLENRSTPPSAEVPVLQHPSLAAHGLEKAIGFTMAFGFPSHTMQFVRGLRAGKVVASAKVLEVTDSAGIVL